VNYGMFTEFGNNLVTDIVQMAKTYGLNDNVVLTMMDAIQRQKDFSEITDTEVRECVGGALGWYK
jgi:hypothetical protein